MFKAKVYKVSIPSSGILLEEEHNAHDVITRWNIEEGDKTGVTFLTVPNGYKGITPDLFIFVIDNYVDEQKVETAIATGVKVILFFRNHHDEKNTIVSEIKSIHDYRSRVELRCSCVDYENNSQFERILMSQLEKFIC